jgi:hypothetical protein
VFLYSWSSSVVTMTMKGLARVTADNPVFLSSTKTMIAIGGDLDDDPPLPAATIKHVSPSFETPLLQASTSDLITRNIGKFQYIGGGDHIYADSTYGRYQ